MAGGYSVAVLVHGLGLVPPLTEAEKIAMIVLMAFQAGIPLLAVGIPAIMARFHVR